MRKSGKGGLIARLSAKSPRNPADPLCEPETPTISIPYDLAKAWARVYSAIGLAVLLSVAIHAAARPAAKWHHVVILNNFSYPLRIEIGDYTAPNIPPGVKVGFDLPEDSIPQKPANPWLASVSQFISRESGAKEGLELRAFRPETGKLVYVRRFDPPQKRGPLDIQVP